MSVRARRTLIAIWIYSAREWGAARALNYLAELDRAFVMLAERPGLGTAVIASRYAERRWPCGSHHIYYRASKTTLRIVRILHNRMDPPRHLR